MPLIGRAVLWYLGYDLGEPLPDHSSLTRIRERYGVDVFRRFFEAIVEQCQQEGLVWGKELYVDARHPSRPMPHSTHSSRGLPSKHIWHTSSRSKPTRWMKSTISRYPKQKHRASPLRGRRCVSRCSFPPRSRRRNAKHSANRMLHDTIGLRRWEHKIAASRVVAISASLTCR